MEAVSHYDIVPHGTGWRVISPQSRPYPSWWQRSRLYSDCIEAAVALRTRGIPWQSIRIHSLTIKQYEDDCATHHS